MENNKCAVLVTSCDAYSDAWYPFFELFKIMWKDCKFPIYLNTETKDYSHNGLDIKCLHPSTLKDKKGKDISWSRRLREALQQINSDYIIFMLEDFFLQAPVRADVIDSCINLMEIDESVVFIDFYKDEIENDTVINNEFSEIKYSCDWAINANCALWRKDFLINLLRDDENPWQFEFFGTYRWRRHKEKYKLLTHKEEFPPVFEYQFVIEGKPWSAINKGKWIKEVPAFLEQYGISVDYSQRGFFDTEDIEKYFGREREENWLQNDFKKAFKDPKLFIHYAECLKNVAKDKLIRFYAAYIKR